MSKAKYIVEGGSSNRPPFFDGSDYYFWKNKMQLFLKSQDTGMWRIITDGDFTPRVDQDDSNSALKKEADWTAEDKAKVLLNSKAQLFLSCALSREESERVDECTTAKEVWDTLQTHHEGTSHVKETRIDIGIRKFELFEMQEGETIDEMYSRFTTIVNEMRSLGKAYTVQERVRKIMRCLPIIWRPMVTAISQAKNLESLPLEELIGTLRAHEIVLQEDKPVKKGKAIALKVSQEKITVPVEEESEENEQGDADEIALLTRRIQRMMRRRDQIKKGFQNRNPKTEIDKSQVTCFGCNKLGHYKAECPSNKNPPKRFPFKKKSMMATWDDSEESETEEEEEEANICLMAKTEEDEVMNSEPCHLCQQMGNEFDNLLNDSNLLIQKCSSLKEQFYKEKEEKERNQTENNLLKKMIQELKETRVFESEECQEHSALQTENVQLKNENELLKTDLLNFIKATETFHNIMGSQIGIFDKAGLGFNQTQKTKLYENFFVGFQNTKRKPWFLDSGCSRHMTGDRNCFITFSKKDGGSVTFGNDDQAQIKGNGTIGKTNSAQINDVQYVEGLKHNLLSISQLCDNGCEVTFKPKVCEIKMARTGKIMFSGKRKKNLYVIYLDELPDESCFISIKFLGEGASLVRPPAFNGDAYMYWKQRMLIFLEACSLDILEAVIDGPYVPTIAGTGDSSIPKPRSDCADEFFKVSNCKTAKEMWDTLQQTHEGTTDIKRARINTLMHEYELFNMKNEESVNDMQTRFTHIVNNLNVLGKVIDNEQQISKVMRCLTREWQPKITAIAESKDLGSMSIVTLFGKLREHEMELHRLSEAKQTDRKRKGLSLKAQAHQTKSEQEISTDDSNS
uniref:Uncharacterized protein LOC113785802 n=1 Tax=Cicer arietinum TaxID=3827 RepID=A0A3Q7Y9B8_CICAR|nr:uncharacterized protein LOC113785802 [Cicer arietinum]